MTEHSSLIADLEAAIASGSAKKREKALTLVSNLFVAGSTQYSGDQIAVFGDVLDALATDIETQARVKLAHQLAKVDYAPSKVIRSLAFDDEIAVAEPVLRWSQVLERCRSDRQCQHQEPGPSAGDQPARNPERMRHRHPGRARQPSRRALHGEEPRRALFRARLRQARHPRPRGRGAAAPCRHAPRPAAPSFPETPGNRVRGGARQDRARISARRGDGLGSGRSRRDRHQCRGAQRLARTQQGEGAHQAPVHDRPIQRDRAARLCARGQFRADGGCLVGLRAIPDRSGRARLARRKLRHGARALQGRRLLLGDDQVGPAAVGRKPRHVGHGHGPRAVEL